jgi:4-hydroxy-L-threonine phosphate dehydrogenase PdxA
MIRIAVIDGMGGGIGAQIAGKVRQEFGDAVEIIVFGSNAVATDRMIRAGANRGATGENALKVSVAQAEYIIAPLGAVIPNSMMGEITPAMAEAVMNSPAEKLLIPVTQQHFTLVGLEQNPLSQLVEHAVGMLKERCFGG